MISPPALKSRFETHLDSIFQSPDWNGPLHGPMRYILELKGKRIRPVLLLLAYQAVTGKDPAPALNAAAAVEFFHNFSLIHDDIMDNDPIRRGMPTVHEKYGVNAAILSGDAMFALTFELLVRDFPQYASALVKEYTDVSVAVCVGQMDDMLLPETPLEEVPIPRTLEMLRKKTAVLIGGSMSLGAICAGAEAQVVADLREYGELTGLAFQLQDDFLDVYGDQELIGKRVGTDILENKKTFLLLKAFEKADASQKKALLALLHEQDPGRKIAGVKAIYAELGIPEETQSLIRSYFDRAEALGQRLAGLPGFGPIAAYFEAMVKRDH